MKKLFTSMGLAAMSLFAAAPTFAQQSLTANQAETVVKTVFPAVMEQVKLASGLDIQAIAEGNMDWTLYSRIPTVTVQPDSARVKVTSLMSMVASDEEGSSVVIPPAIVTMLGLDNLKINFTDYQKINFSMGELTSEISLPGTTAVDLKTLGSIKILIEAEPTTDANATMPFKKLVLKSEVSKMLESLVPSIPNIPDFVKAMLKSGTILTVSQSSANGVNTVTTEFSETGMAIAQMMADEGETPVAKFSTATDMTKMATDNYYTVTRTDYLPNGTAIVDEVETVYNPTQTLPLIADSIVTKNYKNDGTLSDITKRVFKLSSTAGAANNSITKVTTDSITVYTDNEVSASFVEKDSTILVGNKIPLDYNKITLSFIQSVIADMATLDKVDIPFGMVQYATDEEGKYIQESQITMDMERLAAATTAEADTIHSEIMLADYVDGSDELLDEASAKVICIGLTKDQAIICLHMGDIDATEENKIATIYAKSNLLSIATDNEEIAAPQSDVTFGLEANGIYVNNCKQGRYTIVDMNGRIVANGVIAGEGAFVATQQLTRGSIYVIAVQDEKGLVKAAKFAK